MDKLFYPSNTLLVGMSQKPNNLGRKILGNFVRFGYRGNLFLLGREAGEVDGHRIVASFDDLPEGIDLAVILTPAPTVPGYLEACGRKGVKFAIVESGGFGELSPEGRDLELQVLEITRRYGMRVVGPNCTGVVSVDGGINTVFLSVEREEVPAGHVSLLTQSGGVGLTHGPFLAGAGLGLNKLVSVGNKVDLKEADFLEYFMADDATQVVHCYLESIVDGRKMLEVISRGAKPVVAYKANTGLASARMAQSHTAALANDDRVVTAAFKQFGVTRASSFRDMAMVSKPFSMPPVRGRRLAVMSRSGGHAIVVADMASAYGFELPPYPQKVLDKAGEYFRAAVLQPMNPLDVGPVFNFDAYADIIRTFLEEMKPDAVMLVFFYQRDTYAKAREITPKLEELSVAFDTPIALVYFAETDEIQALDRTSEYPIFWEVSEAMRALAASRDSHLRRKALRETAWPDLKAQVTLPERCRQEVERILGEHVDGPLPAHRAMEVCEKYGIPVAAWALAGDAAAAVALGGKVGYPLALKVVSPDILHKSDVGGVALGIKDESELERAVVSMQERLAASHPTANITGFLLQKMVSGGREVLVGSMRDRAFGPTVVFGLGGVYVEVFDDAAIRVAPITRQDAEEMIEEPRSSRLLAGIRGEAPADKEAIVDCLLRLSKLVTDFPQIREVDINPLLVFENGAVAVDARILTEKSAGSSSAIPGVVGILVAS